jgi:ethanolamine permease
VTVGTGMALATSVFTMVSGLFRVTNGPGAVLSVALAGLFCVIIAQSVGELASMFPSAPAIRTYLKTALGDRASLVLVYLYLFSVVLVAGLESFIFAQVFRAAVPSVSALPVIVALFLAVTAVNLAGLELPRSTQIFTAIGAVLCVTVAGLVGIAGWRIADAMSPSQFTPELFQSVPAATGMAVFLYMGFEWVTPLGLRPKSYHFKVPVSMVISVGVLMVAYGTFVMGAALVIPRATLAESAVPQVLYMEAIYGPTGVYLALALALSATVSTFNAGVMGGSRLIYLLAREGHGPAWCGSLSLRTGAPIGAVLLLSTLALASGLAVLAWNLVLLVAVVGAAIICVLYASFLLSTLVLRKRRPTAARPYRSRIWSPLQWFGVVTLPLLGIGTLLSEPSLGILPLYGCAAALACAALLTTVYGPRPRQVPQPAVRETVS